MLQGKALQAGSMLDREGNQSGACLGYITDEKGRKEKSRFPAPNLLTQ